MMFARVLVLPALLSLASSAEAVTVTLNPGSLDTTLRVLIQGPGLDPNPTESSLTPASLPLVESNSVSEQRFIATSFYALSNDGFTTKFDHARPPALDVSTSSWSMGPIQFSVDADVDYELSGNYVAVDAEGRLTKFSVRLIEAALATTLANSLQESRDTVNESLVLGGSGGDSLNVFQGSLTGTLVAGREYTLEYTAQIGTILGMGGSQETATASGSITLAFVPEPSFALLVVCGLLGLGAGSAGADCTSRANEILWTASADSGQAELDRRPK